MVKIQSQFTTYPTRLILRSPCNKVEQKQSYTWESNQHNTRFPHQAVILVVLPKNTSGYPPTTDILGYQSVIPISTSMVNNSPKCISSCLPPSLYSVQNFLLTQYVLNKSGDHIPILRKIQCQITVTSNQGLMPSHYPTSR